MYADIEALVLSGELFNPSGSDTPPRADSPSSDHGWHDDELNLNNDNAPLPPDEQAHESIGMGPGRTGVKGVIRDRDEAEAISKAKRAQEMDELRGKMERQNLGGKTFLEEEEERFAAGDEKVDPIVLQRREKARKQDVFGRPREGKFGHLREIGLHGFVSSVENEAKGVWVVVHLYEPSLDRCYALDETLSQLARLHPNTKFLRCRASALGFTSAAPSASRPKARPQARTQRSIRRSTLADYDSDDDPYVDNHDEEEYDSANDSSDYDEEAESRVDLDMLPTMLVYRNGELVHNWVRVDWEAQERHGTIEELLDAHKIIPRSQSFFDRVGLPSDDEHRDDNDIEFLWGLSDDEDAGEGSRTH